MAICHRVTLSEVRDPALFHSHTSSPSWNIIEWRSLVDAYSKNRATSPHNVKLVKSLSWKSFRSALNVRLGIRSDISGFCRSRHSAKSLKRPRGAFTSNLKHDYYLITPTQRREENHFTCRAYNVTDSGDRVYRNKIFMSQRKTMKNFSAVPSLRLYLFFTFDCAVLLLRDHSPVKKRVTPICHYFVTYKSFFVRKSSIVSTPQQLIVFYR